MPRIKKAEREAVITALTVVHDTVDDAAEAAIIALDAVREHDMTKTSNRPWCVLMQAKKGGLIYTFGPYPTESKASKAVKEMCSPSKIDEHAAGVFRLYDTKGE